MAMPRCACIGDLAVGERNQGRHRHKHDGGEDQHKRSVAVPNPFHVFGVNLKRGANKDQLAAQFRREY